MNARAGKRRPLVKIVFRPEARNDEGHPEVA
jgi:hypothetical protein